VFLYGLNRDLYGCALVQFTEVVAGVVNVAFGFQNAVAADSILDNGAGLKTSGSTLAIYKVDGEQTWRAVSACAGVATVSRSNKAAVAATWYFLEINCEDWDGIQCLCSFKVDGEYLRDFTTGELIRHRVTIASATEMQMFLGVKLGGITNSDTLSADFWYGHQRRGRGVGIGVTAAQFTG
jgi:hypothetical protein